jgi:DNA helicase HerA-like ATPase
VKDALGHSAKMLGMVVDGSLTRGVEVRLDAGCSVEDVKVGTFATIQGRTRRFFGVITEVSLGSSHPNLKGAPPDVRNPFIAQVLSGTVAFGTITVLPRLTMPVALGDTEGPEPAKTIPAHFSWAYSASQQDVEVVFGKEDDHHFYIGNPLDMDAKVCLDLDELVKRSVGVFGKSGTGKTFLARLLLMGIVQRDQASVMLFDMHNEYGWQGRDAERNREVKGLKQVGMGPSKVAVFTLDEESSRRRGAQWDETVALGMQEIEPEDVELLRETLNLSEVAAQASHNLRLELGPGWLEKFLNMRGQEILELAKQNVGHQQSLNALHRSLNRLKRYDFLKRDVTQDSVQRILEHLDRGMHVVLEFGRYQGDLTAYILVANLLTRRIHERYVTRKEEAEGGHGGEPRNLVIVIEEAHKFLNPSVAPQTIFGTIAREMRKYNVTLLVIDQRPGGIEAEVMSQIGTKFTCLLDNDRDIDAVLSGTTGSRELRGVLSRLESKQQALIFGHAVPMPVVIEVREYGSADSYEALGGVGLRSRGNYHREEQDRLEQEIKDLFS